MFTQALSLCTCIQIYITLKIYFIVCDALSDPASGTLITGTGVGDRYYCDYGYELIGDRTFVTCQSSGNWSGPPPTCKG